MKAVQRASLLSSPPANPFAPMVGHSPALQHVLHLITQVAPTRLTTYISGETGTGKELVAAAVHRQSDRANRPYVVVHCSAIPESLIGSELFGYERGAFTGAAGPRRGLIEEANGGTLFLDEISTLTPAMQVTLLRVLEDRSIRRVGSNQEVPVDFRLIVATNEDLSRKVERGEFREDFYYRLRVFPIEVPPLRERREDIPLLAEHFRRVFAQQNGIVPPPFLPSMLERLSAMDWPGNVRQLRHFVEQAIVLRLGADDVRCVAPMRCDRQSMEILSQAVTESWSLERLETEYMRSVLQHTDGHWTEAAAALGIDRRTLQRRLSSHQCCDASPDIPADEHDTGHATSDISLRRARVAPSAPGARDGGVHVLTPRDALRQAKA